MSYEADEYYRVYRHTIRRSRHRRRCEACGLEIGPMERYVEVRVVYAGTAETYRRCGRCETVWQHLRTMAQLYYSHPDDQPATDERLACGRSYQDEWEADPPEEIAAVVFATAEEASRMLTEVAR